MTISFTDHVLEHKFHPIHFVDHPEFKPDLTPRQIFELGSFGGTYWREIHSMITNKNYKNEHKKFPFLKDLPDSIMTRKWSDYDTTINKYKVKVGTTLEFWEDNSWIKPIDPYGWIQWYCNFYNGRRSYDDTRQIKRWQGIKNRFGNVQNKSPAIKQTLQHWAIY